MHLKKKQKKRYVRLYYWTCCIFAKNLSKVHPWRRVTATRRLRDCPGVAIRSQSNYNVPPDNFMGVLMTSPPIAYEYWRKIKFHSGELLAGWEEMRAGAKDEKCQYLTGGIIYPGSRGPRHAIRGTVFIRLTGYADGWLALVREGGGGYWHTKISMATRKVING